MYKLKPGTPDFQVMDGPFAKRSYREGEPYAEKDVPPNLKHLFVPVVEDTVNPKLKTKN